MTLKLPIKVGWTYRRRDGTKVEVRESYWAPGPDGTQSSAYVGDQSAATCDSNHHAFLDCGRVWRGVDESPFDLVEGPLPTLMESFSIKAPTSPPVPNGFKFKPRQDYHTYAMFRAQGWTDEQMQLHGYLEELVDNPDEYVVKVTINDKIGGIHVSCSEPTFPNGLTREQYTGYLLGKAYDHLARREVTQAREVLQQLEKIDELPAR